MGSAGAYRAAGYVTVPAALEGKRAIIPWKRYQSVPPTLEQLVRWQKHYPRANLALVTGPLSGVVVVDVDVRHHGDRTLVELERRYGALPRLAVVQTPSGGWHFHLRHPGGRIPNSTSRIGLGIDPRGEGGLALLPPSRRADGAWGASFGGMIGQAVPARRAAALPHL